MQDLIPRDVAFDLFQRTRLRVEQSLANLTVPPETPIPHLKWNVGDLATHLVQGQEIAGDLVQGAESPYEDFPGIAKKNDELLRERTNRNLPALAREFAEASKQVEQRFAEMPDDFTVPFHGGTSFRPAGAMTMLSCELLLHGWDLSRATGEEWEVSSDDARPIIYVVASFLDRIVDEEVARGFVGTYELRIRGGETFRLHFDHGDLTVSVVSPGGPADCRISADPAAFLLMGYGRGSQAATLLTGKVVAWGRKPWLAGKFTTLLRKP